MEQTTLKYLRLLIPGFIILLGLLPIKEVFFGTEDVMKTLDYNYLILFSLIVGSIYYQLNIQHLITRPSHYFINRNICNKIIEISESTSKSVKEKIWNEKIYIDVFYCIIDNDESLKRKGLNVTFNGIFWTSSADLFLISLFYWLLYNFTDLVESNIKDKYLDFILIIILLSAFLHIVSVIKHIKLGNEQLKTMHNRFSKETKEKTEFILSKYK